MRCGSLTGLRKKKKNRNSARQLLEEKINPPPRLNGLKEAKAEMKAIKLTSIGCAEDVSNCQPLQLAALLYISTAGKNRASPPRPLCAVYRTRCAPAGLRCWRLLRQAAGSHERRRGTDSQYGWRTYRTEAWWAESCRFTPSPPALPLSPRDWRCAEQPAAGCTPGSQNFNRATREGGRLHPPPRSFW